MADPHLSSVLELLDPPKGFTPWHGGPTLMGSLRGVDHNQAAWKPAPDRHSIWELALHIAYWKYSVCRYMDRKTPKGFERSPANWPEIGEPSAEQWKEDKKLIRRHHEALVEVVGQFPDDRLNEPIVEDKEWTFSQLITGIAAHDTYHIGQIQLMKRLYKSMNNHSNSR